MKKTISKVLVIAMIISLFASFSVYANGTTASGNQFEVISMSYENEEGASVTAPWSNGACTVNATLQRIGTEADSAALIGAVYDGDNKLVSADSKGYEYAFPGVKHSYELNFTFPENVEGCVLRLYLWDSVTGLKPIGNGSEFSNISNSDIEKIWIDGNLLAGFDKTVKEYTVELPMSTGDTPEILAECADLSTKVETTYSDNADGSKKITVTATANSGESSVYVINYTVKQVSLTAQLVYDFNNGTEFEKKTEDIALSKRKLLPPEYQYDDEGNIVDFGNDVMNYITTLYKDTDYGYRMLYVDVPDELKGAEVLHLPSSMRNNASGESTNNPVDYSDMVVRLTLNKSATFYFPATQATAKLSGAQKSTIANSVTWWQVVSGGDFKSPANYKDSAVSVLANRGYGVQPGYQGDYQYELFLEVPEGVESKTFEIPIVGTVEPNVKGSDQFAPHLWLKWADNEVVEEELEVTNITLTGDVKTGGTGTEDDPFTTEKVTLNKSIRSEVLAEPKWDVDADGNPVPTIFVPADTDASAKQAMFESKVVRVELHAGDAMHHFYTKVSDELKGAKMVSSKRNDFFNANEAGAKLTKNTATFTLNKSATLYYYDEGGSSAAKYGAELQRGNITLEKIEPVGGYSSLVSATYDPNAKGTDLGYWLYKLELIVPEGQDSQEFTIDFTNSWSSGALMYFK